MAYIDLPDMRLWYTDSGGTGTPVIFLHAASGNCDSWFYQVPVFTAAGYRCIAYDRRGWGRSELVPPATPSADMSDDLHSLVTQLGLDRFHLVATAAGSITGLDYALTYPERVYSLVAACTIGGIEDPSYLEVQHRLRPPDIQNLPVELREVGPSYRGLNPEGTRRWLDIEQTSRRADAPDPRQALRQPISYTRLETMRIPVLMIAGQADLLSPPALMRLLAAPIPSCQFATVPEAGHAAFWEQPDIWNNLVLEFIRQYQV